jgi:hypothetical protein
MGKSYCNTHLFVLQLKEKSQGNWLRVSTYINQALHVQRIAKELDYECITIRFEPIVRRDC